MKKLDILVPQYSEDDSVIKPLLDSIMIDGGPKKIMKTKVFSATNSHFVL